jgi:single-stranded DNA-binding protein
MTEPFYGRSIARNGDFQAALRVNNVSLIGTLVGDPQFTVDHRGRHVCVMQIAVPRRRVSGEREPGVVYVDVSAFDVQARNCAKELAAGDRIGVSGTLERDDSLDQRPRRSRWEVHAHQIDLVDQATPS